MSFLHSYSLTVILVFFTSTLLYSCAVKKQGSIVAENQPNIRNEQILRARLSSWLAEGALATTVNNRPITLQFRFIQCSPHHYDIYFFGPLRITLAHIKRNNDSVTLEAQGKKVYLNTKQANQALAKFLPIPLEGFKDWLKGAATQASYSETRFGLLTTLEYQSWKLNYQHYTSVPWLKHGLVRLPDQIQFANARQNIQGKIIIHRWQLDTLQECI